MLKKDEIACTVESNGETIEKQCSKATVPRNILHSAAIYCNGIMGRPMCVGHSEHRIFSCERACTIQSGWLPKTHLLPYRGDRLPHQTPHPLSKVGGCPRPTSFLTVEIPFPTKHRIHLTYRLQLCLQLCRLKCTKFQLSKDDLLIFA